ncbi:MAG: aminopeptidase P family protein [Firmicutes bacterium]|nr:aminopeptidase P family protein [Bacillota bacterium]
MEREGIDMWVVIARENNEDQLALSLLPAPLLSASRRTMLVFFRQDDTLERLNLSPKGSAMDLVYDSVRQDKQSDQWQFLRELVAERKPRTVAANFSETFAEADGLTSTDHRLLQKALAGLDVELVSGERLAVAWLETRTTPELEAYTGLNRIAHDIIAQAFSSKVILPGVTTAVDVAWWMRQRIQDLGLRAWFHPTVNIQRQGDKAVPAEAVIQGGDLLHCDMGLVYLGLCTDTQQLAYVRRPGEESAPQDLERALAAGNLLQDITVAQFAIGKTGNQVLADALAQASTQGLKARVYTHPIGVHGHAAGPTIGLFDKQDFVAGSGDYPLYDNTCYALELNVITSVPTLDQDVMIPLEQTVAFTQGKVQFLGGRQTRLHLI